MVPWRGQSTLYPPFSSRLFFFFNDPATTEIYTLSLHDALPICLGGARLSGRVRDRRPRPSTTTPRPGTPVDRKSTRLNSSHMSISYAVFCLKKKKTQNSKNTRLTDRP